MSDQAKKFVYFFGEGKAEGDGKVKDLLGGRGAGLAEMTSSGIPVPPDLPLLLKYVIIFTAMTRTFLKNFKNSMKKPLKNWKKQR